MDGRIILLVQGARRAGASVFENLAPAHMSGPPSPGEMTELVKVPVLETEASYRGKPLLPPVAVRVRVPCSP